MSANVVTLGGADTLAAVRQWLSSGAADAAHQGYPVLDERGVLIGVVTRRDLLNEVSDESQPITSLLRLPPKFVYDDSTARQAVDHMLNHDIGRLPVVRRANPREIVGIVTRRDILSAYRHRLRDSEPQAPELRLLPRPR